VLWLDSISSYKKRGPNLQRKILIIVENLPVPFDTRVWKESLSLQANGYDVTVLCPRGKGYEKNHEVIDGVHIYRHPLPTEGNSPLGYVWEYGCAISWEIIYSWWIFMVRGFQIIQACNPPDNIFLVALPFKLFGVKYIFDFHDANPELYIAKYNKKGPLYHVLCWFEKMTFRVADVAIATNQSYGNIVLNRGGLDPGDVFIVRNGPDLNTFKLTAPNPELKHNKKYLVGYVGTMSIQEGLDILLNAALCIKKLGRTDIHFTCVGGGPSLVELREMVVAKGLQDTVNFTGRIPDAQLLEILSTADVCVNPDRPCEMNSISTMIKIMEYMALGKPIVQFDMKEGRFSAMDASVYADNNSGAEGFAGELLSLLGDPERRKAMGEFGQDRVKTTLAWEYSVQHLLNAYERAYSKRSGPLVSEVLPASRPQRTAGEVAPRTADGSRDLAIRK
jgi:glycosyltransferase involved in cell wall biosynthesis